MIKENSNRLKEALQNPDRFAVTWELVPGRFTGRWHMKDLLDNARQAAEKGLVDAVSVTDNPGGNPALPPEMVAPEILNTGVEPLVHIALRDKNRTQIESLLYSLAVNNIRNLLVISGDYTSPDAYKGRAMPAFDLDPAHVMQLIGEMNHGLEYQQLAKTKQLEKTDFYAGVGVSPFKKLESEVINQYFKLEKKIRAGASFVISQIGFDARKMHELVTWMKYMEFDVPVLANIYVLTYPAARAMHENRIPGAVVTADLLKQLKQERESDDKGKAAAVERAAKMYAMAKGMGYAGVHIGGFNLAYQQLEEIVRRGEELTPAWLEISQEFFYPQAGGYYFFLKDEETNLNQKEEAGLVGKGSAPVLYRFTRILHEAFFDPGHPFFGAYKKMARWTDRADWRREIFAKISHLGKVAMFNCMDCGDCALMDLAYLCPVSQCPKERRVGACGGSFEGWCEVYPGKKRCIWVRAYDRLQVYDEEGALRDYTVPPRDWELWQTPSQLNYYLGRDHTARRLNILPPP